MQIESLHDGDRCGEGPVWDDRRARLIWTDIEGGVLREYDPATNAVAALNEGWSVSCVALTPSRSLVVGNGQGLHVWRGTGDVRTLCTEHDGETLAINDMIADARGRIYAGTIHWGPSGMERHGRLHLITRDGAVRVVDDGIELANGLGFSHDDAILYFTDSAARRIYAYDVDAASGDLRRKRVFVTVPGDEGIPDGLTVDAQGFVWSAQWYGGQVVRYDPDGRVERRIKLPVTQVASLAFGGRELDELYITTAGDPWRSNLAPPGYDFDRVNVGGALYRARPGVRGRVERRAAFE